MLSNQRRMKFVILLALGFVFFVLVRSAFAQDGKVARISPTDAAKAVREGSAILVDVREPAEWREGVAASAYLLPLSDLRGNRRKWAHVLKTAQEENQRIILYCRSGGRSGQAAGILEGEGFAVANAGGFGDWRKANLPVRAPEEPADPR
jgi:rhodanese-related sulfurtransferase